jgi:hypothetical protein
MDQIANLQERCRELGKSLPRGTEPPMKTFAKYIVEAKILDDDAFEVAAEAFLETNKPEGEINVTHTNRDQMVAS